MNYHNILHDDMRNGTGLRVTLFVSGCNNKCQGCQNPQTWDKDGGILFDNDAVREIIDELKKPHINGLTLSGGDPMHENNVQTLTKLCQLVKQNFPDKTIWLYTGHTFEEIYQTPGFWGTCDVDYVRECRNEILKHIDVLVDGRYVQELNDVNYHWAGSTNQRVIDVPESLKQCKVVLYEQE